jgi:hypothetical protein
MGQWLYSNVGGRRLERNWDEVDGCLEDAVRFIFISGYPR